MTHIESLTSIASVWQRNRKAYANNWWYSLLSNFAEPILYMVSFGVGMSAVIANISVGGHILSYRAFVFSGIVAQSLLYQGFFVALYGGFSRIHYQKMYVSIATTQITLSDVLWAELIWNASRATLSSAAILLIGSLVGDFAPLGTIIALPLCFVATLLLSALGMLVAALCDTYNDLSYAQFYLATPMFLVCGIFFPLDRLPFWLEGLAWLFPLTPVLSVLRSVLLDLEFQPLHLLLVLGWTILAVTLAHRMTLRRIIK